MAPGPWGRSAFQTGQGSICADRRPSGVTSTGRDTQGDGGLAKFGWKHRQEVDANTSGEGTEDSCPLSPGLRLAFPGHPSSMPRALATPDSDDARLALLQGTELLLEEMTHGSQLTAFDPVVVDGDDILLKGTEDGPMKSPCFTRGLLGASPVSCVGYGLEVANKASAVFR